MINLIKFEFLKEINKKSFLVIIIGIFFLCIISSYILSKKEYTYKYVYLNKIVEKSKKDNIKNKYINENNLMYEYHEKHKMNYNNKTKHNLEHFYTLLMFFSLVFIILSSSNMSNEISKKTINGILIKPYKRYKVYLSKLIFLIMLIIFLSFLMLITYMLSTLIFNNPNDLLIPSLDVINSRVVEKNYLLVFLNNWLIILIPIIFMTIFSHSLSTITNNTIISLSISIFLMLSGLIISTFLLSSNVYIIEYTFLPYLDFTIFLNKLNIIEFNITNNCNLNLIKGIVVLVIYSIISIIVSLIIFTKKDVNC